MKSLVLLVIIFGLNVGISALMDPPADFVRAGNIAMGFMLIYKAIEHFNRPTEFAAALPSQVPYKLQLVYTGGFLEVFAGVGLMFTQTREITAWLLIAFQLLILLAIIFSAPKYKWLRIPLTVFYMVWTWYFALYLPGHYNPFRI